MRSFQLSIVIVHCSLPSCIDLLSGGVVPVAVEDDVDLTVDEDFNRCLFIGDSRLVYTLMPIDGGCEDEHGVTLLALNLDGIGINALGCTLGEVYRCLAYSVRIVVVAIGERQFIDIDGPADKDGIFNAEIRDDKRLDTVASVDSLERIAVDTCAVILNPMPVEGLARTERYLGILAVSYGEHGEV